MKENTRQLSAVISLIIITVIWGSTFILVKGVVQELDVFYFTFLRFAGAFALLMLLFGRRILRADRATIRAGIALGILLAAGFILQAEGLRFTSASNAGFITALYMIFTPLFSMIYPGGRPRTSSIVGLALALPGALLISSYSYTGVNIGDLIMLVCAIAFAWHIVCTGEFIKRHALIPLVGIQFLVIAIICGTITLILGTATLAIPKAGWSTIAYLSFIATGLPIIVMTAAQRVVDATRAGLIYTLEAVFAAIFAWWLAGETFTPVAFTGACLMLGGMIISEIHPIARYVWGKVMG